MLKKFALLLPLCLLLAAAVCFAAGDAADPLVSLSYLTGAFTEKVDALVDQRLSGMEQGGTAVASGAAHWTERQMKKADQLVGVTGTNVLVLAGGVQVVCESGEVVDVSAGTVVPSGSALVKDHRYMVAENGRAVFTVTSKTAVLDYQGPYEFRFSQEVDYPAMATALKTLHLFQGSFTGYGQGFDLEAAPTRLQALIMFIRVLGEEEQALAWSGQQPFKDIAKGTTAEKYVGYAYAKGYTNGYSAAQFKPAGAVNAYQYTEFLLRAMGYSSASNTDLGGTLARALDCGLLTAGEAEMLKKDPFLRGTLVYESFYALETILPDGGRTLADALMEKGVFGWEEWQAARGLVSGWRL